jgi:hypothetical protein
MVDIAAIIDAELARPPTRRLSRCSPLAPLPGQADLIHRAVALARRLGLTVPARLHIFTVDGSRQDEGFNDGQTSYDPRTGHIEVWLNVGVGVMPEALAATTLHELMHVNDAVSRRPFDRLDWEQRAWAFATRAMEDW